MRKWTRITTLLLILSTVLLVQLLHSKNSYALVPSGVHRQRYIESNGSYTYYTSDKEAYIKSTLPNEWIASWGSDTLKAGAVIIRSGVYWRMNRSIFNTPFPNNNCYQGGSGATLYYRTAPRSRGGQEQWVPGTSHPNTNAATDATVNYHAEWVTTPSGQPDKLVPHRYGSGIQNNTNTGTGTWIQRIRYAYITAAPGSPYNPNTDCSQAAKTQSNTDPTYPNN